MAGQVGNPSRFLFPFPPALTSSSMVFRICQMMFVNGAGAPNAQHALFLQLGAPAADDEETSITRQLGKAVRMFSIIDTVGCILSESPFNWRPIARQIFLVIWSFSYWPLIFGLTLAICGYYGANRFKPSYILVVKYQSLFV